MRLDGNYGEHSRSFLFLDDIRPIKEKNAIRALRLLLGVNLEDFHSVGTAQTLKFMRLQRGMAQVGFQQAQRFGHLLVTRSLGAIVLQPSEDGLGRFGEHQFPRHA